MAAGQRIDRVAQVQALKLSSALLLGGFLFNAVVTMLWHPTGAENDHREIFTEYAQADGWVATHLGQFIGVSAALAGLVVLALALRGGARSLSLLGAAAAVATASVWAVLQGLDGVALKETVDTWLAAQGPEKAVRFADAETVRWLEWGFQSYFRLLFGLSLLLVSGAIIVSRQVPAWLGWVAALAGVLTIAIGIDVGYSGLESGFQDSVNIVFQLVVLVFIIGLFVTSRRDPGASTA